MSHPEDDYQDDLNESEMARTFQFEKFVEDLERRERLRREMYENVPTDHNQLNRQRDAQNREQLHNRIRWSR